MKIFVKYIILKILAGIIIFSFITIHAYSSGILKEDSNYNNPDVGTILPQTITSNMQLILNNSPYLVNQDVTVLPNVRLIVDPGVEINFVENAGLYVFGEIEVNGTENNKVILKPEAGNDTWDVISLITATGLCKFSHVEISGSTSGNEEDRDIAAISAYMSDLIVDNVNFYNVEASIYCNFCDNVTVTNSQFISDVSCNYIKIKRGIVTINNCVFTGNEASDTRAIDLYQSAGNIDDNYFRDFNGNNSIALYVHLFNPDVTDNVNANSNIFAGIAGNAVLAEETANINLNHNLIVNSEIGIEALEHSDIIATNNTLDNNNISFSAYRESLGQPNVGNLEIINCIISGSGTPISYSSLSNVNISYTLCSSELLPGTGNVVGDPLYVNPGTINFHIQRNSPAIDKGDIDSPKDPDGTRADIGAYYFHQSLNVDLVISEIHYKPFINGFENEAYEFIEVYNNGVEVVNLGGAKFGAGVNYTFEPGTQIQQGEYIIIVKNLNYFNDLGLLQIYQWDSGVLDDGGETIRLEDDNGYIFDEVKYSGVAPWPVIPAQSNASIEIIDPSNDNNSAENWRYSLSYGGSPGKDIKSTNLIQNINIDKTLTIDQSPYIANYDVIVAAGVKLTVQPGVIVMFAQDAGLYVHGSLDILGESNIPVVFRPINEDEKWEVISLSQTSDHSTINNLIIYGCYKGNNSNNEKAAISVYKSGVTIENSSITNVDAPVYLNECENSIITNCFFECFKYCEYIKVEKSSVTIEGCEFIGNNIEDTDGIDFGESTGSIINNVFYNFGGINGDAVDIDGDASDVLIEGNIIHEVFDKAISIGPGVNAVIRNNLIYNVDIGISVKLSADVSATSNTIANSNNAIYSSGATFVFNNGIIWQSQMPVYEENNSNLSIYYTLCSSQLLGGIGNIVGDPQFVNPEAENFNLLYGSPAIDMGNPTLPPDSDGTRADMGVYYFHQPVNTDLVITEIHYNPVINMNEIEDFEFIEIFNAGSVNINLQGFIFNTGINFEFPPNSSIASGEFIIITKNSSLYSNLDIQVFEWTSGNFDNLGELVRIEYMNGYFIDEVLYSNNTPWPVIPWRENYSIELVNPSSDNSEGENWRLSFSQGGSPGALNERPVIENIVINEFLSDNDSDSYDENEEYDDWIELLNTGDAEINLAGLYISDDFANPGKYRISDNNPELTILSPGDYIVLWADNQSDQGVLHLNFSLSSKGEEIIISQQINNQFVIIDSCSYLSQLPDISLGRVPDGGDNWEILYNTTPGTENIYSDPPLIEDVVFNEVSFWNEGLVQDEFGEYEPWFELYNSSDKVANLCGLFITDDPANLTKWEIKPDNINLTMLSPGFVFLFWADNDENQGPFHCNINLNFIGGYLALVQIVNSIPVIIDQITYQSHESGTSTGRYPDGIDNWLIFNNPTPGSLNVDNSINDFSGIYINEVLADNTSIIQDDNGDLEDWIEIYNSNSYAVNLAGLYLSDDISNPFKWRFGLNAPDETIIEPEKYLLVWADNQTTQGNLHANFKLGMNGETVMLVQKNGNSYSLIDSLVYPPLFSNNSYGKFPDGSGSLQLFLKPTPGTSNEENNTELLDGLYINEIMAVNSFTFPDNYGEFEDWIEIYNSTNNPIDIGGLFISDNSENLLEWQISSIFSDSTTIQPGSNLVLYADNNPQQGVLHLGFKLSGNGENVILSQPIGNTIREIDNINFPSQEDNISFARLGDGNEDWQYFKVSTPGLPNLINGEPVISHIFINELLTENLNGISDFNGDKDDWIEIYNGSQVPVNLGGMYFSNNLSNILTNRIQNTELDSTTLLPGEFKLFWADNEPYEGVLHLDFEFDSGSGNIFLSYLLNNVPTIIDSTSYHNILPDESYGRKNDGSTIWEVFANPSPEKTNILSSNPNNNSGLFINEVMALNNSTITDEINELEDWIEIYNSSQDPIDIGGYYISDDFEDPYKHRIPTTNPNLTTISPGGYIILWADSEPEQGELHLNFKLGLNGEDVVLSKLVNIEQQIVDFIQYPQLNEDISYGRYPDGGDLLITFNLPSPGYSNGNEGVVNPDDLVINEFMAWNGSTYQNENGDYKDWIEIYNKGNSPMDLGGFYISNSSSDLMMYQIPFGSPEITTISGKGFLVFRADELKDMGPLHLNFRLSRIEDEIILSWMSPTGIQIIDSVSFDAQDVDVSMGRTYDASPYWKKFDSSTPGFSNGPFSSTLSSSFFEVDMNLFPNPFTDIININFSLNDPENIKLLIYNQTGSLIRDFSPASDRLYPGKYNIIWDGKDNSGNRLPIGIYYCKLVASNWSKTLKAILLN